MNLGEQLDDIMRRMSAAYDAWVAAGYGYGTPLRTMPAKPSTPTFVHGTRLLANALRLMPNTEKTN